MFQLQPPCAAATASYRPPSENMRRRRRRAQGEARDPGERDGVIVSVRAVGVAANAAPRSGGAGRMHEAFVEGEENRRWRSLY